MRNKIVVAAALALGLGQAAHAVEPPVIEEPVRGAGESAVQAETLRFGLTGTVSARTLQQLTRGERVPVIVMLDEPKVAPGLAPGSQAAMVARISQISQARENALFSAFGVNGFERAGAAPQEREGGPFIARLPIATVTHEFVGTPGFSAIVSANEIERLRTTPGVAAIYEDEVSELTLADTTLLTGAQTAWAAGVEGSGKAVAILDTGVELEHPMTAAAVTASACFNQIVPGTSTSLCPGGAAQVTDLTSGSAGDSCVEDNIDPVNGIDGCFHGTHVGSTSSGRTVSLTSGPISGVARQSDIIAVNVFAEFGPTNCGGASACVLSWTSDQIAALDWLFVNRVALNLGAVNMSLGGGRNFSACDSSDPRTTVINNLRAAGVATVIASGNNGWSNSVSTPGCISSAITVGSTTKSDAVSSFSNSSSLVDLMAPGSSILAAWQSEQPAPGGSCIAAGTPRAPGPDGFCHWYSNSSGTSMATPHVAGAFAMLSAAFPAATVTDIENALESTGVGIFDSRNGLTIPRIQIDAAYNFLLAGGGPANNDFADRITVSGSSVTTTGNNSGADKESGEPNHARPGGASVWWSWTAPANGTATVDTAGSNYDTMLGVYTGTAVNALTTIGTNDDASGLGLRSRVTFTASAGVTYQIAVDGYLASTGDITLNITQ
jgi:subtilisin family serine protease